MIQHPAERAMKTSKQCPKCNSLRIGHLDRVPQLKHIGITDTRPDSDWLGKVVEHGQVESR